MSRDSNYDHHISIFSPQGRLYQMEYCFKAAHNAGLTVVAVRGKDSVAVVTQLKNPDRLQRASTRLHKITPQAGVCLTGSAADCASFCQRARYEAGKWSFANGYTSCPVSVLARRMADLAQTNSQTASMRPLAVTAVFVAVDDEDGPSIYKVDCAGHYLPYRAVAVGPKDQEAMNYLEKNVPDDNDLDPDQVTRLAITCLGHVLGSDFRGSEIEVATVTGAAGRFTVLSEDQVEDHLNKIADED